jgi:hypothetical protein
MGSIHIPIGAIIRTLGGEAVVPPPPDTSTVQTGVRLAPEQMCIPFKITLGNMVRCLEAGADTLVYTGGSWSCRYGYYGPLQYEILKEEGYDCRMLLLRRERLGELVHTVVGLSHGSWARAIVRSARAARQGWHKSSAVDAVDACWRRVLPSALDRNLCSRIRARAIAAIDRTDSVRAVQRIGRAACAGLEALSRSSGAPPMRVRIVGESYCVLEPFITFDIVRRLGELGVRAEPFLTAHRWLGFHGLRLNKREVIRARRAARGWWRRQAAGPTGSRAGGERNGQHPSAMRMNASPSISPRPTRAACSSS